MNSIGVGGTNASAVLAPPPAPTRAPAPLRERVRLVLSARTRAELDAQSHRIADALDAAVDTVSVGDASYTLRVGRRAFEERRVVEAAPRELSAVLRMPRPPAARTVRAAPRRGLVVLPPESGGSAEVVDRILAALPEGTEAVHGPLETVPEDHFAILVGHGEAGPDRHVLMAGDGAENGDQVDAALAAAWLHGVEVDWETQAGGAGRRVHLPTYPFSRKRYWALDRLSLSPGRQEEPSPTAVSTGGSLEEELAGLWKEYFGSEVGPDDEFGALGGTSLLSVQMVLEIQRRHGVLVNVHRAGGSRATVRRIAEIVRGMRAGAERGSPEVDPVADGDGPLIDADLQLPLGELSPGKARGRDVLVTGATGYLGAFLLHELVNRTKNRVYALVRAADEAEGWERLRATARKFALPAPDPERVVPVVGDLREVRDVLRRYRGGELGERVGHVLHCAARVVFTEPYRVLRQDNVLSMVEVLRWMRECGVRDFSYVSTLAATGASEKTGGRILETRDQPLDPDLGGYGVSKWVGERLLERAEQDGMRVRVFRPGLIMAATGTGACNEKDLIWFVLAAGVAVGAHPKDDRAIPVSPVDVLARGIVELAVSSDSVGRAYHLVAEKASSMSDLFAMLAEAGLPTRPMPHGEWQRLIADRALATQSTILSPVAAYELEGHESGDGGIQAGAWQSWLRRRGLFASLTGDHLRSGLVHLAGQDARIGDLLPALAEAQHGADTAEEVR
ncbi:thioester reductase domain-containing protein [Allosalinactinospora lopnorensis]|uniref:thioester reductase domain-containing protein n=1 Tax=Allosalinactinospora lopnorensis TaxID=1352348 RepID=UPI0006978D85|nr:thioester reductase domain-containing protein [Allosalinactinospora lopnorensis]